MRVRRVSSQISLNILNRLNKNDTIGFYGIFRLQKFSSQQKIQLRQKVSDLISLYGLSWTTLTHMHLTPFSQSTAHTYMLIMNHSIQNLQFVQNTFAGDVINIFIIITDYMYAFITSPNRVYYLHKCSKCMLLNQLNKIFITACWYEHNFYM